MHDPHDQPILQSTGFRVGTGVSTSVSLTLRNVSHDLIIGLTTTRMAAEYLYVALRPKKVRKQALLELIVL